MRRSPQDCAKIPTGSHRNPAKMFPTFCQGLAKLRSCQDLPKILPQSSQDPAKILLRSSVDLTEIYKIAKFAIIKSPPFRFTSSIFTTDYAIISSDIYWMIKTIADKVKKGKAPRRIRKLLSPLYTHALVSYESHADIQIKTLSHCRFHR